MDEEGGATKHNTGKEEGTSEVGAMNAIGKEESGWKRVDPFETQWKLWMMRALITLSEWQ